VKRFLTRATLLLIVVAAVTATGCATVRPWQRDRLSDRCMQFDPDAARVGYMTHWQESREGSSGGFGVQGGGCGCK
jgi:Domain of unknown function (DUF4266)